MPESPASRKVDARERTAVIQSDAMFSPCRIWRYWLTRTWDLELPTLCVIGVNPSTADEKADDPTIRKCIGFARRLGYGRLLMLNVGALRATDPRVWGSAAGNIGPFNSAEELARTAKQFDAAKVVAAWGKNGSYARSQCAAIIKAFPDLWCWGFNGDGTPVHPLMLPYSTELRPIDAALTAMEKPK